MTRLRGFINWWSSLSAIHHGFIFWAMIVLGAAVALFVGKFTRTPPVSAAAHWKAFGFVALAAFQLPCALLCASARRWAWWGSVICVLAYAALAIRILVLVAQLGSSSVLDAANPALASLMSMSKVIAVSALLAMAVFLAWLIRLRLRAPAPEPSNPAP